jgi:hypothetical protein
MPFFPGGGSNYNKNFIGGAGGLAHRNDPKIKVDFLMFSYFQFKVEAITE